MSNKSNPEANIRIGRMLQAARESYKVSQVVMAKATGMSQNHISAIECGQSKASVELLMGYCKKLDMTPNDMLGYYKGEIIPELKHILIKMDAAKQRKILQMIRLMDS